MNARAPSCPCRCLLAAAVCLGSTGCFSKAIVRSDGLDVLQQPNRRGELVLQSEKGAATRLGPGTKVRFLRTDDEWSAWVEGRDLCVTSEAVFQCSSLPGGTGLPWKNVTGLQTKNLNGAGTYFTIVGGIVGTAVAIAMTVAAVAAVAGLAKGGGGGGGGLGHIGGGGGGGSFGAHTAAKTVAHPGPTGVISRSFAPAEYGVAYAIERGWAWYGPPLDEPALADEPSKDALLPVPLPGTKLSLPPQPLFTKDASRKGHVRFVGAVEGGTDFLTKDNGVGGASLAFRLGEAVELGGGVHLAAAPGDPADRSSEVKAGWMGFGRLLTHFDCDADRRVALLLGLEAGAGEPRFYGRAMYGLRVRLVDGLSVGIYPFNASLTYGRELRPSFPSTAELSYAF